MKKWEEKKYQAAKENNVLLYNAMISYEMYGDVSVFIDVIEILQKENKEIKSEFRKLEYLHWEEVNKLEKQLNE